MHVLNANMSFEIRSHIAIRQYGLPDQNLLLYSEIIVDKQAIFINK
jgi:hypothetical protein